MFCLYYLLWHLHKMLLSRARNYWNFIFILKRLRWFLSVLCIKIWFESQQNIVAADHLIPIWIVMVFIYLWYKMQEHNMQFFATNWRSFHHGGYNTIYSSFYQHLYVHTLSLFHFFLPWQSCTHFSRLFEIYVCYQDHKKKCQQLCSKILINVDVTFLWLTVIKLMNKISRS